MSPLLVVPVGSPVAKVNLYAIFVMKQIIFSLPVPNPVKEGISMSVRLSSGDVWAFTGSVDSITYLVVFIVTCLRSYVRYQTSDVCLMSGVWSQISYVRSPMSDIWCLMSDLWIQMSNVSCQISDVCCLMSGLWCLMSDDWYQTSDVSCQTYNVCCLKSDVRC